MPEPFETFEPSQRMRLTYERLLTTLEPWGALLRPSFPLDPRLKPGPPAAAESLIQVHEYLQSSLPQALERFWEVADGLRFDCDTIVFSTTQFIQKNDQLRTLTGCMPFNGFYFIGSMGDGDMFAMGRTSKGEWHDSVMIWEHETDRRYKVAQSLVEYVAKMIVWWGDESHA